MDTAKAALVRTSLLLSGLPGRTIVKRGKICKVYAEATPTGEFVPGDANHVSAQRKILVRQLPSCTVSISLSPSNGGLAAFQEWLLQQGKTSPVICCCQAVRQRMKEAKLP